jgi:hypothetical protein
VNKKVTKISKTKLKLISVISLSAFSLIAVVTASFAWFANNKNTKGGGMSGNVDPETSGSFSALTLHRCINNESTETVLKFNPEDNGAEAINLDYYSELNTSQPVLLLFKMQAGGVPASEVHLSVKSNNPQPYSVIEATDSTAPNYYDNFSLSSAVQFRAIAYTSSQYDTTGDADPFVYTIDISGASKQSFVDVVNDELVWVHKTDNNNDAGFDLYNGTGSTLITYLALIMDYNSTAINYIYDHNTENEHDIKFNCDFTFTIS